MSTYVYCFARSTHPLPLAGASGVGSEATSVRVLREGELAAVVSDAPANLRAKRRDLTIHDGVITNLHSTGTVIPLRFGTLASDDEAVRSELRAGARHYRELLARLDGHVELNVKGVHQEDSVLRDLLSSDPVLGAQNDALQATGGGSHYDKLAFGERVAAALEERRVRDAERTIARLLPHAADVRGAPRLDGCFLNVSFLVMTDARRALEASLAALERDFGGSVKLRMRGPLPPYSFVAFGREA
jgi:hypothetical protein